MIHRKKHQMSNTDPINKVRSGSSPQSVENIDFFIEKFKEQLKSEQKITFRTAIRRLMNLIDLID